MTRILLLSICLFLTHFLAAQFTVFTWEDGTSDGPLPAFYGDQGVASDMNIPGARTNSVTWTDASGNLWLFGGFGSDASGNQGVLNDLWKWDGGEWTWEGGSSTINSSGVYGTKGTAAPSNMPGARSNSVSWKDVSGNLWLFGGVGIDASGRSGRLNDLWKWDGSQWTWVSGSSSRNVVGNYGSKGVAATSNVPGARIGAISWIDLSGNLWLFGGSGYDESGIRGHLNDLWKWDGGEWTWEGGSSTINSSGVYGTKGTAAPSNMPGARFNSVSWKDESGNFWLFGGFGSDASGNQGLLNDLWKWDGSDWTWVGGSNTMNAVGVSGSKGTAAVSNMPGARSQAVSWMDASGDFWLFGGYGRAINGSLERLNDLWKWDGSEWIWSKGGNTAAVGGTYGTQGIATESNAPGARSQAVSWTDASGHLWLFGGFGYDGTTSVQRKYLNDLWKCDIDEIDPIITSESTLPVEENTTGTIYTATADESVTFRLGTNKDEGAFTLTADAISFITAPDYETPHDANGDNEYLIELIAIDAALNTSSQEISVNVTNLDEIAPSITSAKTASVEENLTGTIYTATADESVTFSLGSSKDEGAFTLITDALSFKAAPDYETPQDANGDNAYLIDLIATDVAGNVSTQEVAITVANLDDIAPSITSAQTASVEENLTGTIYTATADESVTFSLGSSKDEGAFALITDALSFKTAPDYETPQDANADNAYLIDLIATDAAGNVSTQEVTITVANLDEIAPFITSAKTASVEENLTGTIYTATADESVTFSLGSSKDEGAFSLVTDALSFKTAPDYETPQDANADNEYLIDLIATDVAGNVSTQEVTITVANLDEIAPFITSAKTASVEENLTGTIYTATADESVTFSLGSSKDEGAFALITDALSFKTAPDYETPQDANADNEYLIDLIATDAAGNVSTQEVTITVANLDEIAPFITSAKTASVEENLTGTIYTATADESVTFSLGSSKDEGAFSLVTDALSFKTAPDYETPQDANADNEYLIDLIATDVAGNVSTQEVTITVANLDEIAPFITSAKTASVEENLTGTIYTATADESVTFSLGSSKDEGAFALITDALSFKTAPDYEAPQDANADNEYLIDLIATDAAGNVSTQEVTITVANLDEIAPFITSAKTASVEENLTGTIYTATADESVTFSLGSSKDEGAFSLIIDALSFTIAPDYETPQDANADNEYLIDLIATDVAGNVSTQEVAITVVNLDEIAPSITSAKTASVEENLTGTIYTATADEAVTFSLGSSKDEGAFALITDALSFTTAPDYETPQDANGDNAYLIDLIATDVAGNVSTQEVAITVVDVEEVLGISEAIEVELFPNPVKDYIFIKNIDENLNELTITNMRGEIILKIDGVDSTKGIDLRGLKSGVYMLIAKANYAIYSFKFMKR